MSDPIKAISRHLHQRCAPWAEMIVDRSDSEDWHSLLFDGGRHQFALRLIGDDLEPGLKALPGWIEAADFSIAGHLIADLKLVALDRQAGQALLALEALTIADQPGLSA